jgi:hypothetical protein
MTGMKIACCRCGKTIEVHPGVRYAKCPPCKPYTPEQQAARYAKRNALRNARRAANPFYRRRVDLWHRIVRVVRSGREDTIVQAAVGCRVATLRRHLERQFARGMTWANHGYRWHIDHIKQKNGFWHEVEAGRLSEEACLRRVHHYTNLRPKWIKDNLHRPWRLREAA